MNGWPDPIKASQILTETNHYRIYLYRILLHPNIILYWNGHNLFTPAPRTLFARPGVQFMSDVIRTIAGLTLVDRIVANCE